MIVTLPEDLPLDSNGRAPRPLVVLLGNPGWQRGIARELEKRTGTVVITNADPAAENMHPLTYLALQNADLIVAWCGPIGEYVLSLDDWVWLGWILARMPQRLIYGVASDSDHPMEPLTSFLAGASSVWLCSDPDQLLAAAIARCQELRARF
jgi:hypothetical protein